MASYKLLVGDKVVADRLENPTITQSDTYAVVETKDINNKYIAIRVIPYSCGKVIELIREP